MKPFIGVDITEDKKNESINGLEFAVQSVSEIQSQVLENAQETANEFAKKAKLPLPINAISSICGVAGFLGIGIIVESTENVTIAELYQKLPWAFWACGLCLVVWATLTVLAKKKERRVFESDEGESTKRRLDMALQGVYTDLGVPENAETVDLLAFRYKSKNDKIVAKETYGSPAIYLNIEFKAFVEDSKLMIADVEKKFAFDLSEIKAIRTVKKHIIIPEWHKETPHNKGEYKQYKLVVNNAGIHIKKYHIVEFCHNGEEWGIYIPCYELPKFEKLTGLKAE